MSAALMIKQKYDNRWLEPYIYGAPAIEMKSGNHAYFHYPIQYSWYPLLKGADGKYTQGNQVKYSFIIEADTLLRFKTKEGSWYMLPVCKGYPLVRAVFQSKEDAEEVFGYSVQEACQYGSEHPFVIQKSGASWPQAWRRVSDTVYINYANPGFAAGEADRDLLNSAEGTFLNRIENGELLIEGKPVCSVTDGVTIEQDKPGKY